MLFTQCNEFNWQVDNLGSTFTEAGMGTSITANASANTKNSTKTTILSALAENVYWVAILFTAGATSGASARYLVDIHVDPAGGTAWETAPRIANLAVNSATLTQGGVIYQFPLYIPAGASVGAACQAETGSRTLRVSMIAYGKPSRPELLKVGSRVVTYGATTASTTGTAVTPGASGTMGSYSASLGTTSDDHFYWQMGILINDTTQTAVQYLFDLAVGDASNKRLVINKQQHINVGTTEQAGTIQGLGYPYKITKAGDLVYARGVCSGTADASLSAIAYAVVG